MAAKHRTRNRGGRGPPRLGSKRIMFLTSPLGKWIMVDERGSDRCPRRPSDVESPSLLGSSEDHKVVPLSPLFLSPAPLRSVQEPGRVQQRPGALRCGRPLVQSLPRHTPEPCSHVTFSWEPGNWGRVGSIHRSFPGGTGTDDGLRIFGIIRGRTRRKRSAFGLHEG